MWSSQSSRRPNAAWFLLQLQFCYLKEVVRSEVVSTPRTALSQSVPSMVGDSFRLGFCYSPSSATLIVDLAEIRYRQYLFMQNR